ncbi:FAD-dependent oxidoreductase [Pseudomonas aeruginosa]|nr:FAD-dependent oxidoreductase [Pseudomonas aeruginosa]
MSHCPLTRFPTTRWHVGGPCRADNPSVLNDSLTRYTFKDGTISLINAMIEDGKPEVRLSTPVKKVEDKGDHVVVPPRKGERIVAGSVVLALPMNVLQHRVLSRPALDPKLIEAAHEDTPAPEPAVIEVKGKVGGEGKPGLPGRLGSSPQRGGFTYAGRGPHAVHRLWRRSATRRVLDRDAVQQVI